MASPLSEATILEVERLAEALGDRRRLAQVLVARSYYHFSQAEYAEGLRAGRRAAATALEDGATALEGEARIRVGWISYYLGDYRYALEELGRAASIVGEDRTRGASGTMLVSARLANWTVRCLAELGEFDGALAHAERALGIAEALNHHYSVASVLLCRGIVEVRRGEPHRAIATLDRAMALCVERDFPILSTTVGGFLGAACLLAGRVDDALSLLRKTVADARPWLTRSVIDLAEACLEAGDADEAQELASGAVQAADRLGERGTHAWGLRLLGEIASRREPGDAAAAERPFRGALGLGAELGMRPLVAHCELALATLAVRIGERSGVIDHLARAADLYREMGMRAWLERADAVRAMLE